MKWNTYKNRFKKQADAANKSSDYKRQCLRYAKRLFEQGVPIVYSTVHLARLVGLEPRYLTSMAYSQEHFYRSFNIPKKNGGQREINEPLPDLKDVQRWTLEKVLSKIEISQYAKAYRSSVSVRDNARFHKKQPILLTVDIKDFFPSISLHSIYSVFKTIGYSKEVSWLFAHLCTLKGQLPQGAPTSPYLSNLIMREADEAFANHSLSRGYRYTRYADDLSFSGELNVGELLGFIEFTLRRYGFFMNKEKTRVANRGARQSVTGIIVNEHLQVPREVRRRIRQEVHYIQKYGLESHLGQTEELRRNYLHHLLGKINHVLFVNPRDKIMAEYRQYVMQLIANM